MSIFTLLALGIVTGGIGAYISERKGRRHLEGFLLGFFFGLIGILISLLLPKREDRRLSFFSFFPSSKVTKARANPLNTVINPSRENARNKSVLKLSRP